jgi:HAD superfamily hydrolase (TIGR01509 family)
MSWELVIFDCDGVLVDSEPIANRILTGMLNELGLPIGYDETMRSFVGRSMSSCLQIIEERLGRSVPADFVRTYNARSFAAFRDELHPIPGVTETLARIRYPVCVASSASHDKMRTTLSVTGLLPRFEGCLFSATDVGRGKPDPALFLHAASRMGAAPRASAVVEDTRVGVQAGLTAGMAVFGFARAEKPSALAEAGVHVFTDMLALADLLEEHRPGSGRAGPRPAGESD